VVDCPLFVGDEAYTAPISDGKSAQREVTGVTGQYSHNIDAKGRLFIPAKLREELGETFHVTIGQDHCLSVFSDESWNTFMERLKDLSYSQIKKLRPMFANAANCEPDGQGRILIPAKLRQYAGLTKEVVVIGSFDRVEIWDAARWAEEESDALTSGALEQAMEELGM
jgi:MraZ protein